MPSPSDPLIPDLNSLTSLFYPSRKELGEFTEVGIDELPAGYRRLLAHNEHMTVTVEEFYSSPVDVQVLDKLVTPTHYARKVLLLRQSDRRVVQYGIMRVNLAYLPPEVQGEIQSEGAPLGRILIAHNVLRRVQLFSLRRIVTGEELQRLFGLARPAVTYGRTALIECNGVPAIELLEIVAPLEE